MISYSNMKIIKEAKKEGVIYTRLEKDDYVKKGVLSYDPVYKVWVHEIEVEEYFSETQDNEEYASDYDAMNLLQEINKEGGKIEYIN